METYGISLDMTYDRNNIELIECTGLNEFEINTNEGKVVIEELKANRKARKARKEEIKAARKARSEQIKSAKNMPKGNVKVVQKSAENTTDEVNKADEVNKTCDNQN